MKYKKIKFPNDGKEHKSILEWWYFNGNLKDNKGNKYSFMNCLFKTDAKKINLPFIKKLLLKNYFFSHYLISDIKNKKFQSVINPIVLVSKDSFSRDKLFINYVRIPIRKYINNSIEEIDKFKYRIKTDSFDLILTSKKKPLLAGGNGFLNKKSKYENYYYSLTNLDAEGIIKINGKIINVKGKSWMDHQWADTPYEKNIGWSWFSIQLENNTEIMCYEFIHKNKKIYLANMIDKNGKCKYTKKIRLIPIGEIWKSKKTGAEYPLKWNLQIPSWKLNLNISPIIKKQEMIFGIINYWEGPIKITGKLNKKKIKGDGFMELVGYPMEKNLIEQYKENFESKVFKGLNNLKKRFNL